jgi:hypothetical protein
MAEVAHFLEPVRIIFFDSLPATNWSCVRHINRVLRVECGQSSCVALEVGDDSSEKSALTGRSRPLQSPRSQAYESSLQLPCHVNAWFAAGGSRLFTGNAP